MLHKCGPKAVLSLEQGVAFLLLQCLLQIKNDFGSKRIKSGSQFIAAIRAIQKSLLYLSERSCNYFSSVEG